MGLFGDFINQIAGILGENMRIKRTAKITQNMNEETKKKFNKITQLAKNGNIDAMIELAQWYYRGQKIGYEPDKAIYWWTKAAEKGDVNSQYNLGLMYHGKSSPISFDEEKAGYWFYKAAKNGDAEAKEMLDKWYEFNSKKGKWNKRFEPLTNTNGNSYNGSNQASNNANKFSYEKEVKEMKRNSFSFVDCSGAYRRWGDSFIDHKGNWCSWGSGFYDYDDNYIHWGNTYKDSSGAYRHWGDDFVDGAGNYVRIP